MQSIYGFKAMPPDKVRVYFGPLLTDYGEKNEARDKGLGMFGLGDMYTALQGQVKQQGLQSIVLTFAEFKKHDFQIGDEVEIMIRKVKK